MKKINRDELRKLINESMNILSRDDTEVDAFIDKILMSFHFSKIAIYIFV